MTFGDDMTDSDWSLNLTWTGEWTDDSGDYNSRTISVTYTLVAERWLYELQRHETFEISVGTPTRLTGM